MDAISPITFSCLSALLGGARARLAARACNRIFSRSAYRCLPATQSRNFRTTLGSLCEKRESRANEEKLLSPYTPSSDEIGKATRLAFPRTYYSNAHILPPSLTLMKEHAPLDSVRYYSEGESEQNVRTQPTCVVEASARNWRRRQEAEAPAAASPPPSLMQLSTHAVKDSTYYIHRRAPCSVNRRVGRVVRGAQVRSFSRTWSLFDRRSVGK